MPTYNDNDDQYLVHRPDPHQPGISPLEQRLRQSENALAEAFTAVGNDAERARLFARTAEDYAVEVALDPGSSAILRGDAREVLSGVKQLRARADRLSPPKPRTTDAAKIAAADRFANLVNTLAHSDFPAPAAGAVTSPPAPPSAARPAVSSRSQSTPER